MSDDIETFTTIDTNTIDGVSLTNLGTYMLFEEINEETSLKLCEFLLKANIIFDDEDTVTLFLNSPGGDSSCGWAIIDLMESSRINVATRAVGEIASMASAIFVAGTKGQRIMTPNTSVMTHQFSTVIEGKAHELVAVRKIHDHLEEQFIQHFVKHTAMTAKQVKDVLLGPSDTWLTPKECLKYGICDSIALPWDVQKPKVKKAPVKRTRVKK